MVSRSTHAALWRQIRQSFRIVVALLAVLLLATVGLGWYQGIGSLEETQPRILLTVTGVTVALWMITILVAGMRRYVWLSLAGLIAVGVAQACYLTLVWTEWKPFVPLWRAWWLSLVPAVALTHLIWLRLTAPPGQRMLVRAALVAAGVAAVLWLGIGLSANLLDGPGPTYLIALVTAAGLSAVGSLGVWIQSRRQRTRRPMRLWHKGLIVAGAQAVVIAIAFYAGRITAPEPTMLDLPISPLAQLPPGELDEQINADLARLKVIAAGIDDLAADTAALKQRIGAAWSRDGRSYYLPSEEDELRSRFMTYLAYRAALLRMVATYRGFAAVPDPAVRARCFLVGYGAGATVMRASTMLMDSYGADPAVRRKLNEADPACDLPPGEFDRIHDALLNERNVRTFEEMAAYFQAHRASWDEQGVLPADTLVWLDGTIDAAVQFVAARGGDRTQARISRLVERIQRDAYEPYYDAQSVISTLIGDTRIVSRPPFIQPEQVRQMQSQLRPGDILLERRNWYASNAFLPGFWPHAALYVGTIDDLQRLGLVHRTAPGTWTSDDPAIRDRLHEYLETAHDDEPHTVLESVSEGVIFNSLTHSMGADYVAVLRPRLGDEQKAQAIARAFSHEGKPYDFEFDFFSADKLVCTELVYRSYEGLLRFDLIRIMGRDTLPAVEIARGFAETRDSDACQFDFVLFLDAVPETGSARLATVDDFCASITRPRGFNE